MGLIKPIIKDYVTPEMFGAKGDGVSNDTEALKQCIACNKKIVAENSYFVNESLYIGNREYFELCGGGKFYIPSTDLEQKKLFNVGDCNKVNIHNIDFESARESNIKHGLHSNERTEDSLTSNIMFISLTRINDVCISNVNFKNGEFDICSYNCKKVYINNFTSLNTSMFFYGSGNENITIEHGITQQYESLCAGDHHFYFCHGNGLVTIKNVKMISSEHNGRFPIYAQASVEQVNIDGKTKKIIIDGCNIQFVGCALGGVVSDSIDISNTIFEMVETVDSTGEFCFVPNDGLEDKVIVNCYNVKFIGKGSLGFREECANATFNFNHCLFEGVYSTNCLNSNIINFYDCCIEKSKTISNSIYLSDSAYAHFNFYNSQIKGDTNYTIVVKSPNEKINFYGCEITGSNIYGLISILNNNTIIKMINCYGNNFNDNQYKYFESNGDYTPQIYLYGCIFPDTHIRDNEHILGQNNIFCN